jgi:hypothetical protein
VKPHVKGFYPFEEIAETKKIEGLPRLSLIGYKSMVRIQYDHQKTGLKAYF